MDRAVRSMTRQSYRNPACVEAIISALASRILGLSDDAVTYDGKYVFQIFSGFQRLESGVFVFTQDTLEPVGFVPNFGGHHDCVIIPTKVEQLVNSRCTTL